MPMLSVPSNSSQRAGRTWLATLIVKMGSASASKTRLSARRTEDGQQGADFHVLAPLAAKVEEHGQGAERQATEKEPAGRVVRPGRGQ